MVSKFFTFLSSVHLGALFLCFLQGAIGAASAQSFAVVGEVDGDAICEDAKMIFAIVAWYAGFGAFEVSQCNLHVRRFVVFEFAQRMALVEVVSGSLTLQLVKCVKGGGGKALLVRRPIDGELILSIFIHHSSTDGETLGVHDTFPFVLARIKLGTVLCCPSVVVCCRCSL